MIPLFTQEQFDTAKSRQLVPFECEHCSLIFHKTKNKVQNSIKNHPNKGCKFCSLKCANEHKITRLSKKCAFCGKDIEVSLKDIKDNNFCSRSCSSSLNGKLFPKRQKIKRPCLNCGKQTTKNSKSKLCHKCCCHDENFVFGEKLISDFTSTYARHKYQAIRHHAKRMAMIYKMKKECKVCGYDLYVELAHIKGIAEFDKNTQLKIVNEESNLAYLCPNHHWELDHGFLKLERTMRVELTTF